MKKSCKSLVVSCVAMFVAALCLMGSLAFFGRLKTEFVQAVSAEQIVIPSVNDENFNVGVGTAQPNAENEWIVVNESRTFSDQGLLVLDTGYANNPSLAFQLPYYYKSAEELSAMGYNKCSIVFVIEFQEAGYEGNQYVKIASSSGKELISRKYELDPSVHIESLSKDLYLTELQYRGGILVQFNADGYGRDDWHVRRFSMMIKFYCSPEKM